MRSRANIKGHPIHPMLVSFPIAFFIGALTFDILAFIYERTDFYVTAQFLIIGGICFTVLAAIPGIIDFVSTVPPDSSAKKRAAKHGLINTSVLLIFCISLFVRQKEISPVLIICLEAAAVILLAIAGWMGGTLVYRNQIGVDFRYAHAGKWNEAYFEKKGNEIEVASANELKVDQLKLLHINNKRIVVCRTDNGYAAFDDRCTHRGGSLAGGAMICGTAQCPWHGSQFDAHTGAVKAGPAKNGIKTYPVTESNAKIYISF